MGAPSAGAIGGAMGSTGGLAGMAGGAAAMTSPIGIGLEALGVGVKVASMVQSFSEAKKQKQIIAKANEQAEKALSEAKSELEKNYYKGLAVPMQAYDLEREALIAAGAQATEAARESERGVAATAGRIYAGQAQAQAQQRAALGQDIFNLDKLVATEEARLANERKNINLEEVKGYQQQMSDAEKARASYIQQAFGNMQGAVKESIDRFAPLYERQPAEVSPELAKNTQTQVARSTGAQGFAGLFGTPQMQGAIASGVQQNMLSQNVIDAILASIQSKKIL